MKVNVICDDVTRHNLERKAHFFFCDVPYNLQSIVDRFGKKDSVKAKPGTDGFFQRASRGFMGQEWDNQVAFQPDTWRHIADQLYPGAIGAMTCGASTYSYVVQAILESGEFILHPSIFTWVDFQGKGSPQRIDDKIDKRLGVHHRRESLGMRPQSIGGKYSLAEHLMDNKGYNDPNRTEYKVTEAYSEAARKFAAFRYGSQVLRSYGEPIVIVQKKTETNIQLDNIERYGTGVYNVEATRVGAGHVRLASNVAIVHHPECIRAGEQKVKNNSGSKSGLEYTQKTRGIYGKYEKNNAFIRHGDKEGNEIIPDWLCHEDCPVQAFNISSGREAEQYLPISDWTAEVLETLMASEPFMMTPKVGLFEREAGLIDRIPCSICGQIDTERHEAISDDGTKYMQNCRRNVHPTLKPIKLWYWLAKMFTPPVDFEPVAYVPFSGAGSEMIGLLLSGLPVEVVGCDITQEYCDLANHRLELFGWLAAQNFDLDRLFDSGWSEVKRILKLKAKLEAQGQLSLF